jgi:PmbA protein
MTEVAQKTDLNTQELLEVSEVILKHAAKLGADEAEVDIGANKGFTVVAREADVETIEYHQDKVIEVTVYFGKRCGSASLTDIRESAVHDAVEAACHIAKFTGEDPASGLADKEDLAFDYPDLPMTYPWDIAVNDAAKMACDCEEEALAYDKRIISAESAEVSTSQAFNIYANSLGFTGSYSYTRHEISCVLVGKQDDEMQRDYSYTVALDPKRLDSVSVVAKHAAERTVKRLGARKIKTQKAPVIFAAEEARGLLGHFNAAIQGGRLYRKASFLVDHLGKKIFPDFVHIQEHPHLLHGLGTVAFDANGVATRPNVFVEDGVLTSYALSVYSSRMLGMKTTGNAGGTHNLTIKTGDKDLPALLKTMGTGLLVTELMGQGVNILTGDYSRGVGGFWVENGEIQFPVHEVTIAGKLQDIYAGIAEIGNDVDVRGNIRTGSILINEMMIAGD